MESAPDSGQPPRPLTDEELTALTVLDEDFATFEGRDANQMIENEIGAAQKQRLSGDLPGAIVRLQRALHYGRMSAQSLVENAGKKSAQGQKESLLNAAAKLDTTLQLLERTLKEFKG